MAVSDHIRRKLSALPELLLDQVQIVWIPVVLPFVRLEHRDDIKNFVDFIAADEQRI